jgi:hypothetical protein
MCGSFTVTFIIFACEIARDRWDLREVDHDFHVFVTDVSRVL